mmetsp:Transcript_17274/g.42919  ORF Transcript_17274/g.42919 Transcript_17274/m.42919 type:complete len:215 (-) Transcript_17274:1014-1658(-)
MWSSFVTPRQCRSFLFRHVSSDALSLPTRDHVSHPQMATGRTNALRIFTFRFVGVLGLLKIPESSPLFILLGIIRSKVLVTLPLRPGPGGVSSFSTRAARLLRTNGHRTLLHSPLPQAETVEQGRTENLLGKVGDPAQLKPYLDHIYVSPQVFRDIFPAVYPANRNVLFSPEDTGVGHPRRVFLVHRAVESRAHEMMTPLGVDDPEGFVRLRQH